MPVQTEGKYVNVTGAPEPPPKRWRLEIVVEGVNLPAEHLVGPESVVQARIDDINAHGLSGPAGGFKRIIPPGRVKQFQYREE